MVQRGLEVYRYNSPYLKGFLETRAQTEPELLCRFYERRGQWDEACDTYLALGRRIGAHDSVEQRLLWLQSALFCAQMPGSNRCVEPIRRALNEFTLQQSSGGYT